MIAVAIILPLLILGWLWWLFATAPEGWEDEDGFHLGRPDRDE